MPGFLVLQYCPLAVLGRDLGNEEIVSSAFGISLRDGSGNMLALEQRCLVDRHSVTIARDVQPKSPTPIAGDVGIDHVANRIVRVGYSSLEFPSEFRRKLFVVFRDRRWFPLLHLSCTGLELGRTL